MEETKDTTHRARRASRRWITSTALVGAGLVTGGVLAGSQLAQAQGTSPSEGASPPAATAPINPADMTHGPGETLLTGSTADRVEAAALDAVDGTIIRVETDSDGAAYEAHVQKADGSEVTVKIDEGFNVVDTIDGFGGPAPTGVDGSNA